MALVMLLGIQCRCFEHSVRAYSSILRAYFIKIFHSELSSYLNFITSKRANIGYMSSLMLQFIIFFNTPFLNTHFLFEPYSYSKPE